jgi:hypothetical protein
VEAEVLQQQEQVLEQVELVVEARELLPELLERLTLGEGVEVTREIMQIQAEQAVQVSSLFAILTYSEQPYLQLVLYQQVADLEFTRLHLLDLLHSDTIQCNNCKGPQGPFLINIPYKLGKIQCLHLHPDKTLLIIAYVR